MAKPSKRLLAVLSLCILLQQFSPAFTADLSRNRISHNREKRGDEVEEDDQENSEGRGKIANKIFGTILKKGWKFLGNSNLIGKINLATDFTGALAGVLSNSDLVNKAIESCGEPLSSQIKANWEEYNRLVNEFDKDSKEIDKVNLQAESRQIYTNSSFYEYRRTRMKLEIISEEQEKILKALGSEDDLAGNTGNDKRARIRLPSGVVPKIMNIRLTNINFKVDMQGIGNSVQPKLDGAAKGFKGIANRVVPFIKLFMAAWGIWTLFAKSIAQEAECKKMVEKSSKSKDDMEDLYKKTTRILKDAKKYNKEVQLAFDDVHKHTVDAELLDTLNKLKEVMTDPSVAIQSDSSVQGIVAALEEYVNGKSITTTSEENKVKLAQLQRNLNDALYIMKYILECHVTRGEVIKNVKEMCSAGEGSLSQIYQKVKRLNPVDDPDTCNDRIGELFPPVDVIKAEFEQWVAQNKQFSKICLMNNKRVVDTVIEQLQNGEKDPQVIAQKAEEEEEEEEIQAMIEELQNDPRIKDLSHALQQLICSFKTAQIPYSSAITVLGSMFPKRKVTEEEFKNQICPLPSVTERRYLD